ncbi:hypothetical protein BV898_18568 [Hypsibius exemplaris]|uniref:Uncharacterized protein n=1 Tax=Hypsibius exemplaris TaxID=2072580 RepID=A0A9X6NI19_HYPEX|nr:hypothetical protein BV898_18568 [Hypsibius exemplaris]
MGHVAEPQCAILPSFVPHCLAQLGLLPNAAATITLDLQRYRSIGLASVLHLTYWLAAFVFLFLNASSSFHVIISAIIHPHTANPMLSAIVETFFVIETNRGIVFCLVVLYSRKATIQEIILQTEQLMRLFAIPKAYIKKIRRITAAFTLTIIIIVLSINCLMGFTWSVLYEAGLMWPPYFKLVPIRFAIAVFSVFSLPPDILSRVVIVLISGVGMILLKCLKTIRQSCEPVFRDVTEIRRSRCQYYALSGLLFYMRTHLGDLLAFLVLADLGPVCGRLTRLLMSSSDDTELTPLIGLVKNCALIVIQGGLYVYALYSPYVILHRETVKFQLQLMENKRLLYLSDPVGSKAILKELEQYLHVLEKEPLVLSLTHKFQIRENFLLLIATILSSYAFIIYQISKETSSWLIPGPIHNDEIGLTTLNHSLV